VRVAGAYPVLLMARQVLGWVSVVAFVSKGYAFFVKCAFPFHIIIGVLALISGCDYLVRAQASEPPQFVTYAQPEWVYPETFVVILTAAISLRGRN
jgi:hypothetical protein